MGNKQSTYLWSWKRKKRSKVTHSLQFRYYDAPLLSQIKYLGYPLVNRAAIHPEISLWPAYSSAKLH